MSVRQRGADVRFVVATSPTLSEALDLWNCRLVGFKMPHAWDTATLAFKAAQADYNSVSDRANQADSDYYDVKDQGGVLLSLTVSADEVVVFDQDQAANFRGLRHIKFVSSANQTADRVIVPLVECP